MKYISRLDFLFTPKKSKPVPKDQVAYLDSLPWILKQTLFLENEIIFKMRNLSDVGTLIFVTDDTKIKGNKAYDQGNYYEALDIYEQVLACFAWLDFKDPTIKERIFMDPNLDKERISQFGITDEDVEFKERRVINEADRDIETETSKIF
jgi:hypothetical protein